MTTKRSDRNELSGGTRKGTMLPTNGHDVRHIWFQIRLNQFRDYIPKVKCGRNPAVARAVGTTSRDNLSIASPCTLCSFRFPTNVRFHETILPLAAYGQLRPPSSEMFCIVRKDQIFNLKTPAELETLPDQCTT